MLASKDLIRKSTRWRVGDGKSIKIIDQPWLPNDQDPYVRSNHDALKDALVCNLFKLDDKGWDTDIIDDVFEERDKELIYNIFLSEAQIADVRYWCFEMNGTYSVKSAYKFL